MNLIADLLFFAAALALGYAVTLGLARLPFFPLQAVTVRPAKLLQDLHVDVEQGSIAAPRTTEQFAKVVFVVDAERKVHLRRVHTGISSDTDVEVLDGLAEGDELVEGPYRTLAKDLKDGDRVELPKGQGGGKKPEKG